MESKVKICLEKIAQQYQAKKYFGKKNIGLNMFERMSKNIRSKMFERKQKILGPKMSWKKCQKILICKMLWKK